MAAPPGLLQHTGQVNLLLGLVHQTMPDTSISA